MGLYELFIITVCVSCIIIFLSIIIACKCSKRKGKDGFVVGPTGGIIIANQAGINGWISVAPTAIHSTAASSCPHQLHVPSPNDEYTALDPSLQGRVTHPQHEIGTTHGQLKSISQRAPCCLPRPDQPYYRTVYPDESSSSESTPHKNTSRFTGVNGPGELAPSPDNTSTNRDQQPGCTNTLPHIYDDVEPC